MKVFVGWDSRLGIACDVAISSIRKHNPTVEVYPIKQFELRDSGIFTREKREHISSTEFTITRFLTPYLAGDTGYSIFMDCDMALTTDITKVLAEADLSKTVSCVQHDYSKFTHKHLDVKMDGQPNVMYPRKNWSSFMLFNNAKCKHITPDYVNTASPKDLHRMYWADEDIGELHHRWNYMAGYYFDNDYANIHWTDGGPWFKEYRDCPLNNVWYNELFDYFEAKKFFDIKEINT